MAHTPGPWKVVDRFYVWTDDDVGCEVAKVCDENLDEDSLEQADADARLIAAAPELLAIAKWVRDNMEPLGKDPSDGVSGWRHMDATEVDSIVSGVLHFCDEAIAKAEGRGA